MKTLVLNGVAERASYWFLACYFVKGLRAPLASDYLIGHRIVFVLIGIGSSQQWCRIFLQKFPENNRAIVFRVYTHYSKSYQHI